MAYPNPTSNSLIIPATTEKSVIEVYNTAGQLVQTFKGEDPLQLSILSKGVYFIVITDGKTTKSLKVVVKDK
jgi:hypothetical protein